MKLCNIFIVPVLAFGLVSCGSANRGAARASKKASKAAENVSNEKLKLSKQYKKCADKANGDPEKLKACDAYLKAAEAL